MTNSALSSVYVSYRHEGESEAVVERLKHACESRGITLTVDDRALRYRDSIHDFMRRLGAGGCIVVVLSEGYLESKNCMFELLEIEKNRDIRERVFPIVLRGTKIHDAEDRLTFIDYWDEKIAALQARLDRTRSQAHLRSVHGALDLYSDIRRTIDGMMDLLGDMYCPDEDVHLKTDFEALLDAIQARVAAFDRKTPYEITQEKLVPQASAAPASNSRAPREGSPPRSAADAPTRGSDERSAKRASPTASAHASCDVLLLYVNQHEREGLVRAFQEASGSAPKPVTRSGLTYFDFGEVAGYRTFAMQTRMGSVGPGSSATLALKAIHTLGPRYVIAVGVAFGMEERKQKIGQILVSTRVSLYEPQRVGVEAVIHRGDTVSVPHALYGMFQTASDRSLWNGAAVELGELLSGEKLVDNPQFKTSLRAAFPEAIGGEMEAAGIYSAAYLEKTDWIVVKGVCDYADGNKSKNKQRRQAVAAANAASFVLHTLKQFPQTQTAQRLLPVRDEGSEAEAPAAVKLRIEVRSQIDALLKGLRHEPFAVALRTTLERRDERARRHRPRPDQTAELADRLLDLSLSDQFAVVIDAYRQFAESMTPQIQQTLGLDGGWGLAEDLVSWLALLAVRDDWCDRHQALLAQGSQWMRFQT